MKQRLFMVLVIILNIIIIVLHLLGVTLFKCDNLEDNFEVIIISDHEEKTYVNSYLGLINKKKYIIYISKDIKVNCGDILYINGKVNIPPGKRNFRGFDYSLYLKSKKILGTIRAENVEKVGEDNSLKGRFRKLISNVRNVIFKRLETNLKKDNSNLLKGILVKCYKNGILSVR